MAGAAATSKIFGAFVKYCHFHKPRFFNELTPANRLFSQKFGVANWLGADTYSWKE
jgi:hypothetical protein